MNSFICVKCLNPLGQVIVHSSQGPHHIVCPNPPNLKSDFDKLLVNHLVIDTKEPSEVIRLRVKQRMDAIIDAHNMLVRTVEYFIREQLSRPVPTATAVYVAPQPAPVKSPQPEVLDVRKPVKSEQPLKDFCFNCNHLTHKGICNAPLEDDTFCPCVAGAEDEHGRRRKH